MVVAGRTTIKKIGKKYYADIDDMWIETEFGEDLKRTTGRVYMTAGLLRRCKNVFGLPKLKIELKGYLELERR